MPTCGTPNTAVVVTLESSGRLRAAARNVSRFLAKNVVSFPDLYWRTNVSPPEVPTPRIAGGGKENAVPAEIFDSSLLRRALIALYFSSGALRSPHGLKDTKKNAL